MSEQLTACLEVLCEALGCDALPVADHVMVEAWLSLPGFTAARLRRLVAEQQQRGRRISSARYFDPIVRETFCLTVVSRETEQRRPRLLTERPWPDYLAAQVTTYGRPDEQLLWWYRFRWERERAVLGLPVEDETDEISGTVSGLRPGEQPRRDSLPRAA